MKRTIPIALLISLLPLIAFAQGGRSFGGTGSITNEVSVNTGSNEVTIADGAEVSVTSIPSISVTNLLDDGVEIAAGNVNGWKAVNKFGRSLNVDAAKTDIWDGANDTTDQKIWVCPTNAQVHNIASSAVLDSNTATGAWTLQVYGLTSWDTKETSEIVTLEGTNLVATEKAYVIIHRMKVVTSGTNINLGNITATASVQDSLTAMILALEGQTQMAIYGIPSTQCAYLPEYYASMNRSGGATALLDVTLLVNTDPDAQTVPFLVKSTHGAQANGSSNFDHAFYPYFRIPGPAIIKVQGFGSTTDLDVSAGFDLILVDN